MNWESIVVTVGGALLSIGAVSAFCIKYMGNATKWIVIAKDAVETLTDISSDLSKGALTADQITKIEADVAQFRQDLAVALAK